ncbi:DUF4328 domain-containing protein [Kribbella antibiotica]|uniref:DUF4328 domain-containing protein n=1 Tax=Kribbella antibiotica TaxID=190195 RepID=A0A4R4ZX56_9ACTN|nr:DUF4328 domain-containing protein [Kribbella antibiotica]TDD61772.1 DUF4328 domain-containing protein [Kribbella antibiotica]
MQQATRGRMKAPRLRNIRGIGLAASWAIGASAVADLGNAVIDWRRADPDPVEQLSTLEWVSVGLVAAYPVATVLAAVLFIVWLVRARENSEFLCDAKHKYSRLWSGLGWFVPVLAFWVPGRVVQNVATASDPRTAVRNSWIDSSRYSIVSVWWLFWIGSSVCNYMALYTEGQISSRPSYGAPTFGTPGGVAVWSTLSALSGVVAAVLAVQVIRSINRMQSSRPAVAWWHQPE